MAPSETSKQEAVAEARRAQAARLLALGRVAIEDYPSASVAYALASLELADTPDAPRFAVEALWSGPTIGHIHEVAALGLQGKHLG